MSENQKKIWITGASSGIGKALAEEGGNILATSNRVLHNKILKLLKPFTKK
jgi:short-subunit dehydrogenase